MKGKKPTSRENRNGRILFTNENRRSYNLLRHLSQAQNRKV